MKLNVKYMIAAFALLGLVGCDPISCGALCFVLSFSHSVLHAASSSPQV